MVWFQLDPYASDWDPTDPAENTLYPERFPVAAEDLH
jgi:hypothetical protein